MTPTAFEIQKFDVELFDRILARGLSSGIGERGGQMCIEAALCETLGLPHGDDRGCVAVSVRSFKIALNDSSWSSTEARAKGLRDLGLAQLGSLGVVDNAAFCDRLAEKIIRRLLPSLLRNAPAGIDFAAAADRCEREGTADAAARAAEAAEAAWAALPETRHPDFYLLLAAELALETLKELHSPGCALLKDAA